jgi:prepilin signal peptidase PulO-like enzyme (type II secretory pathway)
MVGAGLGALVAVALLMHQHRRGSTIPYAPFLCFGALVALLYNPLLVM